MIEDFRKRLNAERLRQGLSRQELADKAVVSYTTIRNIEQGGHLTTIFVAALLADALEVPLQWLVLGDTPAERTGRWIPHIVFGVKQWSCSECKTMGSPRWRRCPVCEAKMEYTGEKL